MALWKITVKNTASSNGVRVEKGMSVEFASLSNPLNSSANKPNINQLFVNKYGVDLLKANRLSTCYLSCEKIG